MRRVRREDLLDWATYSDRRDKLRAEAMAAKDRRRVHAGDNLTFLFENFDTVRYQIQEMLRAEKIVREEDIAHEIETYNELLGGDGELGCTLLIEIEDGSARARKLREWLALPGHVYVALAGGRRVYASFDERQVGSDRVSSVQYLKFRTGRETPVAVGSDLPELAVEARLTEEQRAALSTDLAG
ncbi:MAG: DUF3501 family protein [Planctomycetota bacterium]